MMSPTRSAPTGILARLLAAFRSGFDHDEPHKAPEPKPKRVYRKREKPAAQPVAVHHQRKTDIILDLIKRRQGATLAEMMTATGWQSHSITATFAGFRRTYGLTIEHRETAKGKTWFAYKSSAD